MVNDCLLITYAYPYLWRAGGGTESPITPLANCHYSCPRMVMGLLTPSTVMHKAVLSFSFHFRSWSNDYILRVVADCSTLPIIYVSTSKQPSHYRLFYTCTSHIEEGIREGASRVVPGKVDILV
jgi:hypothetical protein